MTQNDNPKLAGFAEELLTAYRTKQAIAPLSERDASLTIDDAYDIQLAQVAAWTAAGATIKGYKVGLTSQAMRQQLGVDQPDFGHLTESMFYPEHSPIDTAIFLQPKIEPEVAFVLGRPLSGPGVNVADAIRAVDFVLPAIELIDSRVANWRIGIVDTVADNASSGGLVLGSNPTRLEDVDLARVGCNLMIDSTLIASGANSAVLGSPINALVWLANTLGQRGIAFQPGDVILPGSVTAAYPVQSGSVVAAEFAGLGSVTAVFA
ncbi:MAG: fumarylacetoacetate hydrolase family protein [Propionibacteriaceae bacterium]|jgi:2-keto-4-pentenoate hydratase|nr:fumarylacetoacetate hydrolase family protein [Propionibacteriaceae bacterium]